MNNVFVNLFLKRFNDDSLYSLEDVLKEVKCVIILGMPGSGKTTLLEHFKETNPTKTECFPIRDFGNILITLSPNTQYLLLDGLDEFRNTSTDKISVLTKIANQIQKIDREGLHIAISCREMDWFGDTDTNSLQRYLKTEATIFYVQPLNDEQKKSLADQLTLSDSFIGSFNRSGFLDNPQLFTMLADLYQKDAKITLESKAGLYQKFVEFAKEQNQANKLNSINCIETDEFFKDAGYIAFFYMFANTLIGEALVEEISSQEKGYLQDRLEIVIKSALFSEGRFIHRTIAEYLCAYFLYHQKIQKENWSIDRIKVLLAPQNIVFTELRGVYAWLCAFSQDKSLFEVDPYLQYQYGDNALFSIENKRAVISAVKKYSEKDPYFYRKGFPTASKSFYEPALDDFLIEEYKGTWDRLNHYLFFLSDLLSNSSSTEAREFSKSVLTKKNLPYYYKNPFLSLVKSKIDFLKKLLEQIIKKEIQDPENDLIDGILNFLYPNHIGPDRILEYIKAYQKEESFRTRCVFLLKTPEKKQYDLIKSIFLEYQNGENNVVADIPYYFEKFISNYFYVIIYQESPERFWELMMEFYTLSNNQGLLDRFWERRRVRKEIDQNRKNLLYDAYWTFAISHYTKENGFLKIEYALSFVVERLKPNDPVPFIEIHLKETNTTDLNICLIMRICRELNFNSNTQENVQKYAKDLAKKFGLLKEIQNCINPPLKDGVEPEWKRREEQSRIEVQKRIQKNEAFVSSLSDEERQKNFNLLARCAFFAYMKDTSENRTGLTTATFESLIKIIKGKLISKTADRFQPEDLTIKSIAANANNADRNIDIFYYVAGALNSASEYDQLEENDFFDYLYIVSVLNGIIGNVQKTDFCKWLEQNNVDQAIEILKKYAILLLKKENFSLEVEQTFQKLISSSDQADKEKHLQRLKQMVQLIGPSDAESVKAAFLHNLFVSYHVHIPKETLNSLSDLSEKNEHERQLLLLFAKREKEKISIEEVVVLFYLLPGSYDGMYLDELEYSAQTSCSARFFIIDCLISKFNTPKLLAFHAGTQSQQDTCALFVNHSMWEQIKGKEGIDLLENLLNIHSSDYWTDKIRSRITELKEKEADEHRQNLSVEKAKIYILKDSYSSSEDFFADVKEKLMKIKQDIEDDRSNEKDAFYGGKGNPKDENDCRDVVFNKWNDRYSWLALATSREKMEANNRVDMNIRCQNPGPYEVQIECKKESNGELKTGIPDQLVKKYLNSQVQQGIYLVFCFKDSTKIQELEQELDKTVPDAYQGKIKVICMDLRRPIKK